MAAADLRYRDGLLGPLRGKQTVTIGSEDFKRPQGFIVQVSLPASGGQLAYVTMDDDELSETLDQGEFPNVCGIAVAVHTIRGSSTVTEVVIGKP